MVTICQDWQSSEKTQSVLLPQETKKNKQNGVHKNKTYNENKKQ